MVDLGLMTPRWTELDEFEGKKCGGKACVWQEGSSKQMRGRTARSIVVKLQFVIPLGWEMAPPGIVA